MKISTKSRYAIASLIILAENVKENKNVAAISIAKQLDISKLYLEQIFSTLKRAKLVLAEKGAQGGYRLAKDASIIKVIDIMRLFENNLFEKTEMSFSSEANYIDQTMKNSIWDKLDKSLNQILDGIYLSDLLNEATSRKNNSYMYYI